MPKSSTTFTKGKSGNPSGRPKEIGHVRDLARKHTSEAITVLVSIMNNEEEKAAARVAAAKELLERGYGRSQQEVDITTAGQTLQSGVLVVPATMSEEEWEKAARA
jgi:hypothetical protein